MLRESFVQQRRGSAKYKRLALLTFVNIFLISSTACSSSQSSSSAAPTPSTSWLYFDRNIYFPTGSSVTPEEDAAQAQVQTALTNLQNQTDLGQDYFSFQYADDSLLQPVTGPTSYQGSNWRSFYQIWDDSHFNDFAAQNVGAAPDSDLIVAQNQDDTQQYFIIARLSCFVAGNSCNNATQGEAQAMVWRSFGYLIGLRNSSQSNTTIMNPGTAPSQTTAAQITPFIADFNNMLERIRDNIPAPSGSNGTGGTPSTAPAPTSSAPAATSPSSSTPATPAPPSNATNNDIALH